jgi:uncharacterized protein (DUF58 family)
LNDTLRNHLIDGARMGQGFVLQLPRQAPTGQTGTALTRRTGSSLEFRDYREYQPGDDLRHVDWNAFARTEQLHIKLFREEATPHLDLILDHSASMALADTDKVRCTLNLAGFFAQASANSGFTHQAWLLDEQLTPIIQGRLDPVSWEGITYQARGDAACGLQRSNPLWRPRGLRVLLSDLFWEGDPLPLVQKLTHQATATCVVQILADADLHPNPGTWRLIDSETLLARDIVIDDLALRQYHANLERHQAHWRQACRQCGAILTVVTAEEFVKTGQLEDLIAADFLRVG